MGIANMTDSEPPLRFDLRPLLARARRLHTSVDGVTLKLPFLSLTVKAEDRERRVAREVLIRLADRRVLNARECCGSCIDRALGSLQRIRNLLVDKQVELAEHSDGPLYLLLDTALEGIRQFMTFEERLDQGNPSDWQRHFLALEILRRHIYQCLIQISAIADLRLPRVADSMQYEAAWQMAVYLSPQLPEGGAEDHERAV